MDALFDRHRGLLDDALAALRLRGFWTPFPEVPSGKVYGETARDDGLAAFESRLNTGFPLPGHPESSRVGGEASPWGLALGITYPAADATALVASRRIGRDGLG